MEYSTIDGRMEINQKTHVQAQKATTGAALVALELVSKWFEAQALIVEGPDEFRLEVALLAGMHTATTSRSPIRRWSRCTVRRWSIKNGEGLSGRNHRSEGHE